MSIKKVECLSSKLGKVTIEDKVRRVVCELSPCRTFYDIAKKIGLPEFYLMEKLLLIQLVQAHVFIGFSEMLENALERLPEEHQLLMHSDQGWHYQMKKYRHALKSRGIVQSMSRKGNCYDNSVIENFFGIMKSELLYFKEFESVEHFKLELEKYINYYNNKRMKAKLKMSPVEYRTHFTPAA
jgi:putative transposase